MAKTRKPHHMRIRHTRLRKRRRTHRGGVGFKYVGEKMGQASRAVANYATRAYHGLSTGARRAYEGISRRFRRKPPATEGESQSLLDQPNLTKDELYLHNFFLCKKSSRFTRYTYSGNCSRKNKGSRYLLVKQEGISITDEVREKLIGETLRHFMSQFTFFNRTLPIYKFFVVNNLYVVTHNNPLKQTLEKATEDGKPPPSDDHRVVVPLRKYAGDITYNLIEKLYNNYSTNPKIKAEIEEAKTKARRKYLREIINGKEKSQEKEVFGDVIRRDNIPRMTNNFLHEPEIVVDQIQKSNTEPNKTEAKVDMDKLNPTESQGQPNLKTTSESPLGWEAHLLDEKGNPRPDEGTIPRKEEVITIEKSPQEKQCEAWGAPNAKKNR
jgi:hypothetical protein